MNSKRFGLIIAVLAIASINAFGQRAKDLRFNEVMVDNQTSITDDYGNRCAWIEIYNPDFAEVDIRSCYLTNNKAVLNKSLSAPERAKLMTLIPKGDVATRIPGRQAIVFYADGVNQRGVFHLNFTLTPGQDNWIALYDGNATALIDSITIPASLPADCSYALRKDGNRKDGWNVLSAPTNELVATNANNFSSPGQPNKVPSAVTKSDLFKQKDGIGIAMTIIAMLVVFFGLVLLALAFSIVNRWGERATQKKDEIKSSVKESLANVKDEIKSGLTSQEESERLAAIFMALHEYQQNVHDEESYVITIHQDSTNWGNKAGNIRPWPKK